MSKRSRSESLTRKEKQNRSPKDEKRVGQKNQDSDGHKNNKKRKTAKDSKPTETPNKKVVDASTTTKNNDNPSTWSKSKKKRMRALKAKMAKKEQGDSNDNNDGAKASTPNKKTEKKQEESSGNGAIVPSIPQPRSGKKNSKLQQAFQARLSGSRFRILNEELYTKTSKESFQNFSQNPELFEQYHEGFRHQVESWPVNPVDVMVQWITSKYYNKCTNKEKQQTDAVVVADFGCGDAQLAKDLLKFGNNASTTTTTKSKKKNKNKFKKDVTTTTTTTTTKNAGGSFFKVHSFDLVAANELVTACDMSNVPIPDKSVDVCIFCLSLMGTNLADFIREAHRVLKDDGRVKIAEVRSRIEFIHSNANKQQSKNNNKKKNNNDNSDSEDDDDDDDKDKNKKEGTLEHFVNVMEELGFDCVSSNRSNKMFLTLELKKNGATPRAKLEFSAKPCIYKRR